jgi:hypothetical protein
MTDCLVYWKEFWEDLKDSQNLNYDWYTKSKHFFKQIELDDNLWVVISGGANEPNERRLLQEICISELKIEPYERPFHAIGDVQNSYYFDIKTQSDFAPQLRKLEFVSGKKILARGKLIGRSLQSIRPLSHNDSNLLEQFAKGLKRVKNLNELSTWY